MSAHTSYLAEAAATQGDKELPPWCHPRKVTPTHVIEELEYAAKLFLHVERAVAAELAALASAGIHLDVVAAMGVQCSLSRLSALAQLTAIMSKEANG